MRIRFLRSITVPGGPRYNAGETLGTDPHILTEQLAESYVRRGIAARVAEVRVESKSPSHPPADKMVKGSVRK